MEEWIGYIAGFVTTACYIPQLLKIIRTREVSDISLRTFVLLFCGLGLWLTYGAVTANWPVIVTNAISECFVAAIIIFKITLTKNSADLE